MRHALIALTLLAFAASAAAQCGETTLQPLQTTAADFSVTTSIGTDSLAAEVIPLYGVAMMIFGTAGLLSMMFRRQRGPLQLNLTMTS